MPFPSPIMKGSFFWVITVVHFFQTKLNLVRMFSADANLKRFQYKVLYAKKKTSLSMGRFRVAQAIGIYIINFSNISRRELCMDKNHLLITQLYSHNSSYYCNCNNPIVITQLSVLISEALVQKH